MSDMEMAGFTFDKARVGEILMEIERRKASKKDFVGDTRKVRAVAADGQFTLGFEGGAELYGFTKNGAGQLAEALGVPRLFFDRLRLDARHAAELAHLSNHLLSSEPKSHLFRTLDGNVRSVLSTSYRILDNADLFFAAAAEFSKVKAEIWEARLTDDAFRLYAVAPGITGEVRDEVKNGTHWNPSDDGKGNVDRHVAAVALSNSETGRGGLNVRPATLRMVCANWNVWDESLAQIHLGKKRGEEGWISTETQRLEDRVIWAKVRDVISTAFDPIKFERIIAALNGAKVEIAPDPLRAVDAAVEFCGLAEDSIEAIRKQFVAEKDFSRYGLVQAVTWQTHGAKTDEARDAFDDAGAKILATPLRKILA